MNPTYDFKGQAALVGLLGRAACHASKHGVIGLTKSAALDLTR